MWAATGLPLGFSFTAPLEWGRWTEPLPSNIEEVGSCEGQGFVPTA